MQDNDKMIPPTDLPKRTEPQPNENPGREPVPSPKPKVAPTKPPGAPVPMRDEVPR
ncbi:MAG: hypothetical protein H6718_05535 [Polyangiaceae bacterium]|nr:hypothetical protein [Myxococcales bacterium]MCB9584836.1 hypothetical protein [Polyangiaceae bacterium]MCB9607591.1 hypothetical protein [Polyangiaceae bacterium]